MNEIVYDSKADKAHKDKQIFDSYISLTKQELDRWCDEIKKTGNYVHGTETLCDIMHDCFHSTTDSWTEQDTYLTATGLEQYITALGRNLKYKVIYSGEDPYHNSNIMHQWVLRKLPNGGDSTLLTIELRTDHSIYFWAAEGWSMHAFGYTRLEQGIQSWRYGEM